MQKLDRISEWLEDQETISNDCRYYHLLLVEESALRKLIIPELCKVFTEAHEDARMRIRKLSGLSLDPLSIDSDADDFLRDYPSKLELNTLKGYFGEIFAGIIAEHYSPFGIRNWEVPVFFFRYHQLAFDQLEKYWETGVTPGVIPGRTGDDNLAFLRDKQGTIISALFCEAKCTSSHDPSLIVDAHEKLNSKTLQPAELLRIIEILMESSATDAKDWIRGLRNLYHKSKSSTYERYDMVCYLCGLSPKQRNRQTWIPRNEPHTAYTANRKLEAVEVHLSNVDELIGLVYEN